MDQRAPVAQPELYYRSMTIQCGEQHAVFPGRYYGFGKLRCAGTNRDRGRESLTFGPARLFQSRFFSKLCVNLGQIFPEPFVTLPAQQGVFPVVLPTSLQVVLLLGSESFFHLSSLFLSEIK